MNGVGKDITVTKLEMTHGIAMLRTNNKHEN